MKKLLDELQTLQNEVASIVSTVSEKDYSQQFHPDLSPVGWHLGHCVYAETYWIREQLLGQVFIDDELKSLYVPELSKKQSRGSALPNKAELLEWAALTQSENRVLLESACLNKKKHHLLENNYLLHFLVQHYSQHIETMLLILTEMQLQQLTSDCTITKKLTPSKLTTETISIEADTYNIGSNKKELAYDNELAAHSIKLDAYKISTLPVSNGEYLLFMDDHAYSEKKYWSDEGWQWINKTQCKHPHHWRIKNDFFCGINHEGSYELEENHPVHGLSYYEAEAYANWIGARLPHEYEWEVAAQKDCLEQSSIVWEWCSNTFHPYKGFSAYPYEGYSVPYFDEKHYVLRGGSRYTKRHIKRPSFRNYYTADKRHMFAGTRLVFN